MIFQDDILTSINNSLLRQIKVKENQLKIARECNMLHIAETLQNQLSELRRQLLDSQNPSLELESQASDLQELEFQALMTLLDD